jgi:membrane protein involved in colicin uptake
MADPKSENEPEGGVLAGLPSTRPNRMGRRARGTTVAAAKPQAKAAAKRKAKPKTGAKAAAKPKAKAKAKAAPAPAAPTSIADARKPRPVRAGHPGLADSAGERPTREDGDPGLAGSVGKLASLGAGVAGSVLKGIGRRLPRR